MCMAFKIKMEGIERGRRRSELVSNRDKGPCRC